MRGRRASGRPDHQSRRVSRPELTAGTNSRSQLEVVGEVRRCRAIVRILNINAELVEQYFAIMLRPL